MPVTQQKEQVPEHIQSYLDDIHRTADATEAAIKAKNTKLAVELKAKLTDLFQNAPEEAKARGLIGPGGNISVPSGDIPQGIPESLKQIYAELEKIAAAYNKAVQDGDQQSATELRAKLDALKQKSQEESKKHPQLSGDSFELWIEIHNLTSNRLHNDGDWDVEHGWFESGRVADSLGDGETSYIHMGGALGPGIFCIAYYSYHDSPSSSGSFKWYYCYTSDLYHVYLGGDMAGLRGWNTVDGRIVRFYAMQ